MSSTSSAPDGGAPGWRMRLAALRYLGAFVRLLWGTHRGYTAAVVLLRLGRALAPVATLWVARLILDTVVAAARGQGSPSTLWKLVAIEITVVAAGDLMARASTLVESLLGDLFSNHVSVRLLEHASTLDMEQFEDPKVADQLERARTQAVSQVGLLGQLMSIGQDLLTLATLGGALVAFNPWLGLLLVLAVLPSFWGETHFAGMEYSLLYKWTPQKRELGYLRALGSSDKAAKEVKMFGLSPWIVERYRSLSHRYYLDNRRLSLRKSMGGASLSLVGTGGYYAAYAFVLRAAVRGSISVGQLTFLAGSFKSSRDLVQRILQAGSQIAQQSLYLSDLFTFLDIRPRIVSPGRALPVPAVIREGFAFEGVGFRYPGSERWAVRNVSFRMRPGECLALVGENGAGKTTLTKLLGRLYEPTEGRITLDGVDLREYDLVSLRQSIGVIFQDYIRYDMHFDENIAVGGIGAAAEYLEQVERPGDPPPPPAVLRAAAAGSLADTVLPKLPNGYRQMLGKLFDGGVELSGGEWQKIALARAYMRDVPVRILDEPTAALDARAEYEIFQRFRALTVDRMAVVISHRFSTVRMADRILVLKGGELVEEGPHHELVESGGLYAELFGLQAAGYR